MLRIDIEEEGVIHARIGRAQTTADTTDGRADFRRIRTGVARSGRQRQRLRQKFDVERCVGGLLCVAARDVIKECITQWPEARVV